MTEGYFPHFFKIGYGAIVGSSTHFAIKAVSASVCEAYALLVAQ